MAEEEEIILSKSQDFPDDTLDNAEDTADDEPQSDFVMKSQSNVDMENVTNLFGGPEEEATEDFQEGEEAGLSAIPEDGEEDDEDGEYVAMQGMEEEPFVVDEETESARNVEADLVEEKAAATKIQKDRISHATGTMSSDSIGVRVSEVGVRDRYETGSHTLSGDFVQTEENIFSGPKKSYISISEDERGEGGEEPVPGLEEEEEEEEVEESVAEEYVDREPYYELHKTLMKEYPMLKMKNNFLQRKMAEYFKRRKMEHVLRESDRIGDSQAKYFKKLDALWDLRSTNNMQRSAITAELNEMKELRDQQLRSAVENFEAMQARERDIGRGLIFTKTAKEIPDKFLERLLKNQRTKSKEIMEMRLMYIKLRNNIEEITAAIKALDKIGENHTLIDYEQLKMENQNHADKIEERDEELQKLRTKCAAAIQTLAHLREKSSSTDIDILEMHDKLDEVEMERNDWRERVSELKKERDNLRANTVKLQEESGLLTKPKLLLDMEDTLEQIEACKNELAEISATYNAKAKALEAIKKNIQEEKEYYQPMKARPTANRKTKVWKGRPKLVYPTLEQFDIKQFQKHCN